MSELKRCPFCDGELELTDDGYYCHPFNGCFLDANHVTNNEKRIKAWNTRIPMQNIVDQIDVELESSEKFMREYDDSIAQKAYYSGMKHILQIVKEEGGLNV